MRSVLVDKFKILDGAWIGEDKSPNLPYKKETTTKKDVA